MASQKVLVTGGAGFVGSHTCKALAGAGYEPVTFDDLSRGHRDAVRWGPLEEGSLADRDRLRAVLEAHQPVAALHFAARIEVGESVTDPGLYYRNNTVGSLNLLEALRDAGVGALIFSSTAAVYGEPDEVPIPEDHRLLPINPYGRTKLAVERMIGDFGVAHGLRSAVLRYFNAAGADPDGELGERHEPESHLIPIVLQVAAGRREQISLFGDDYPTPDGTCVRDYVHVSDLADAHVLALDRLLDGGGSGAWNLGTGRGFSVREIVEAVREVTGHAIPERVAPRRPGDPPALVARADRARSELGWSPRFVEPTGMIEHSWRFLKQHWGV